MEFHQWDNLNDVDDVDGKPANDDARSSNFMSVAWSFVHHFGIHCSHVQMPFHRKRRI